MSVRLNQEWFHLRIPVLFIGLLCAVPGAAGQNDDRWWPVQVPPTAVVRTANPPEAPASNAALQMMVQSVAGLAAKAVNEGRGDDLVWVDTGNPNLDEWYARSLAAHPDLQKPGAFGAWDLVDRYSKNGLIKGYLLYHLDRSPGALNTDRPGMDCSVNVATSLAGVLDGILVSEELQQQATAHGLKLLLDLRDKTQSWCFETYKNRFNRRMLCTQDPKKPYARDLAIAHRAFTVYGTTELVRPAMQWLEPLSPILGWNCGDEFANTDLSTRFGLIQTATDLCMNLPVLMAGTERPHFPAAKSLDPAAIDWNDNRSAVSFVDTDGDNVQWLLGNFFRGNPDYWSNPGRGSVPYGWSCCFAHLTQLCPQAIDYALATRSANDSFIEWGGGYFYPDHFGLDRTNRWELLARQARRTWDLMKTTRTRIIGFNFMHWDSVEARKACQVFAGQTDGLLAILAFQYNPYEAGAGNTFWVKDGNGIEVPVISARYSIWEHANPRARSGTPAKIARQIRQTAENTPPENRPRFDWVIVHAWSYFQQAPGTDEDAEDMPQDNASTRGGARGYSPVLWCAQRLPSTVRVVSPEELVWRIRMQHDPSRTKRFLSRSH